MNFYRIKMNRKGYPWKVTKNNEDIAEFKSFDKNHYYVFSINGGMIKKSKIVAVVAVSCS